MKSMIKRIVAALLLTAMVLALGACAAQTEKVEETGTKDLLDEIKDRGYITIATEGNWSPWTYHDESDTLVGLDIEIGKAIAGQFGKSCEVVIHKIAPDHSGSEIVFIDAYDRGYLLPLHHDEESVE